MVMKGMPAGACQAETIGQGTPGACVTEVVKL